MPLAHRMVELDEFILAKIILRKGSRGHPWDPHSDLRALTRHPFAFRWLYSMSESESPKL